MSKIIITQQVEKLFPFSKNELGGYIAYECQTAKDINSVMLAGNVRYNINQALKEAKCDAKI